MPSLDIYKRIHSVQTNGMVRKNQSDDIMNATWWEDINSRIGYLYDYYHDNEPLKLNRLNPSYHSEKIPIDIKFIKHTSQTYDKDQVTFHIQLRPGQQCNVPYYDEFFTDRYDAMFPIGLYIDIEDESGNYNKWLIVDKANINANQFPTYEVLRCDAILRYIIDNVRYQIAGVYRSQNS